MSEGLPWAVEELKQLEAFSSEADYIKQLLWDAQTHLRKLLLPFGAFDLAFVGHFGSGKSYVTYYTAELARDGVVVVDFSEASLSAMLDAGMDLGFEEADELLKAHRNDLVEAILRSGQTPWARRVIMKKRRKKKQKKPQSVDDDNEEGEGETQWKLQAQSLAGPKVYNFAGRVKPATLSRALTVNMDPTKDAWIVARSFVPDIYLSGVRVWLEEECKKTAKNWKKEDLEEYILSEEFVRGLEELPTEFPRGRRIGGLMLLIMKILDWDISEVIGQSIKEQELWQDDEDVLEVAEFLAAKFTTEASHGQLAEDEQVTAYLPVTASRKSFNEENRSKPAYPMGKNGWSSNTRQIGFKEGVSKVKDDNGKLGPRGRWYFRLDEAVAERLSYLVPSFSMVGVVGVVGVQSRVHTPTTPTTPTGERPLARVLHEHIAGACQFCRKDGKERLVIEPRGSMDRIRACPPCINTRFDLGPPPGVGGGRK